MLSNDRLNHVAFGNAGNAAGSHLPGGAAAAPDQALVMRNLMAGALIILWRKPIKNQRGATHESTPHTRNRPRRRRPGPCSDPVGLGLVSSLRQPGGNLTGINVQTVEIFGKRLQLLRAMLPKVSRVAFIWNTQTGKAQLEAAQQAAQKLGVKLQGIEVSTPEALPGAFEAAVKGRAEALMFMSSGFMFGLRAQITALALKHRLPASYGNTASVEAGGLMNYGPNDTEYYRQAAVFVDKIFKGARPADLPVEQPLKWELVINMKTAKALGITVPQALLLQATRMIE